VDEDEEPVVQKEYRSMIGSLLYMTVMRPDIQFFVCLCARFQVSSRTSHRQAVKRIFRYLRYTHELGLLVLGVLFPFAFWFFGCRLYEESSRSEIDFGYLPVSGFFACFMVFSQTI
jgi:hypothetical protein